jgi:threonine dehydratase
MLFHEIKEAVTRLRGVLPPTPLIHASSLSRELGFECHLKLENLQKTGSFKARGAYNRIATLSPEEKGRGVVTASSGNHAQGVAWASTLLGVRSNVVMPVSTPINKYMATRGYGAEVVFHGAAFDESLCRAMELASETGLSFIPPFDDEIVMAGQGTVGTEIMEALPDADTVAVPVGGGGLISGIAAAVKGLDRGVRVIGVEAEASASCMASLRAGRPVAVEQRPTIADGIAVKRVGEKTLAVIRESVDDVVAVDEDAIAGAILRLLERKKLVAEGAGAVTLAAALERRLPKDARKVVLVLSGGNIDVTTLDRVIRLGLIKEGRVTRVSTVIDDSPGALSRLAADVSALRANILHVSHLRDTADVPVGSTRIEMVLEVEGPGHADRVRKGLMDRGYAA